MSDTRERDAVATVLVNSMGKLYQRLDNLLPTSPALKDALDIANAIAHLGRSYASVMGGARVAEDRAVMAGAKVPGTVTIAELSIDDPELFSKLKAYTHNRKLITVIW